MSVTAPVSGPCTWGVKLMLRLHCAPGEEKNWRCSQAAFPNLEPGVKFSLTLSPLRERVALPMF